MYRVFVRNWWRIENGVKVPDPTARKHTIQKNVESETRARQICKWWNATHKPGPLSRKAEYEET